MKRIKIIKSNPVDGQLAIDGFVGREFDAEFTKDKSGKETAWIVCETGKIFLHSDEYEVLD